MTKGFYLKYVKNSHNSVTNILKWTEDQKTLYKTKHRSTWATVKWVTVVPAGGPLSPLVCASRTKSSLDWPSTAWTRWFTGLTSASPPLGEPVCLAGSPPPSSGKVGEGGPVFCGVDIASRIQGLPRGWVFPAFSEESSEDSSLNREHLSWDSLLVEEEETQSQVSACPSLKLCSQF